MGHARLPLPSLPSREGSLVGLRSGESEVEEGEGCGGMALWGGVLELDGRGPLQTATPEVSSEDE